MVSVRKRSGIEYKKAERIAHLWQKRLGYDRFKFLQNQNIELDKIEQLEHPHGYGVETIREEH